MKHIEIRFGDNIETHAAEEKSFEEMFQSVNPMFCFSKRIWKPQMDIFETRNEIVIQASVYQHLHLLNYQLDYIP